MRALRELALRARANDLEGLRELLVDEASALEGSLGVPAAAVRTVATLQDAELVPAVARIVHRARQQAIQDRRKARRDMALAGVCRLLSEAIWSSNARVHLDPAVLLGPVLADPSCKYLVFRLGDHTIPVERRRLLLLRRLVHVLPGFSAAIDGAALRFRWRDGRGGLRLRSPDPSRSDRERVLQIVLTRPGPVASLDASVAPRPSRSAPSMS